MSAESSGGGVGQPLSRAGAALLLVGSMVLMSAQDAAIKFLSVSISLWQFVALRAVVALPTLLLIALASGGLRRIRPKRPWAVVIRTLAMFVGLTLFFVTLSMFTMAEAAGGLYTAPLFIAMLSAALLGERVGPRRVLAILIGFAGAMLILQPEIGAHGARSLLPALAGLGYAFGLIATRRLCAEESALTLSIAVQLIYGGVGAAMLLGFALWPPAASIQALSPALLAPWRDLPVEMLALIAVAAVINAVAHTGMSRAYQSAETSFLAPFDFSYLLFAAAWGVVVWREQISLATAIGMAMIFAAGVYVAWRERGG